MACTGAYQASAIERFLKIGESVITTQSFSGLYHVTSENRIENRCWFGLKIQPQTRSMYSSKPWSNWSYQKKKWQEINKMELPLLLA